MTDKQIAGLMGGSIRTGEADAKSVAASIYLNSVLTATELAELHVRRRLRVTPPVARLVVNLAELARCA